MLDRDTWFQLVAAFPSLAGLDQRQVEHLCAEAAEIRRPSGTILAQPNARCEAMPLLLTGVIDVVRDAPAVGKSHAREILLYRLHPGDACVLTAGCLLSNQFFEARAITREEVRCVVVPASTFTWLIESAPSFRSHVFELLHGRVAELASLVADIAFARLDQRLAGAILGRGPVLSITHQKLADELGSVREIVSRLLRMFEDRGWVRLEREKIEILDPASLRNHAAGGHGDSSHRHP